MLNCLQDTIKSKKCNNVINKLTQNTAKPKELWKCLKSLGLPSKKDAHSKICLKNYDNVTFNTKANAEIFKDFFAEPS